MYIRRDERYDDRRPFGWNRWRAPQYGRWPEERRFLGAPYMAWNGALVANANRFGGGPFGRFGGGRFGFHGGEFGRGHGGFHGGGFHGHAGGGRRR